MIKYTHVIRLDKPEVRDYLNGRVFVTPKLDGTNASFYFDNDNLICQSRKRVISIEDDNAGFCKYMTETEDEFDTALKQFVKSHNLIIYGEWLGKNGQKIGHITDYLIDGFHPFELQYVDGEDYLPLDSKEWKELEQLYKEYNVELMCKPLAIIENPKIDELLEIMDNNHVNLPDDILGEGIVLKNYSFKDKFGNSKIAKIVHNEYLASKGQKTRDVKQALINGELENQIVDEYITEADFEKTFAKLSLDKELTSKDTKLFIDLIYKDLIEEELYEIIIKFKAPTINFKLLNNLTNKKAAVWFNSKV